MFFSSIANGAIVAAMGSNFPDEVAKIIESARTQYGETTIAAIKSGPSYAVAETFSASSAQSVPNKVPGKEHYI